MLPMLRPHRLRLSRPGPIELGLRLGGGGGGWGGGGVGGSNEIIYSSSNRKKSRGRSFTQQNINCLDECLPINAGYTFPILVLHLRTDV